MEKGLVPDDTTYNIIIHAYCKEGDLENAFQFHNKMVENSFKPDVVTCNTLMNGLCQQGKLDKALKLFESWVEKGKKVDVITYNTLIQAMCKDGDVDTALQFFYDMEVRELQPDAFTYNVVLSALSEAGRPEEAQNMLDKLADSGKLSQSFSSPLLKPPSLDETESGKDLQSKTEEETGGNPQDSILEAYTKCLNELCTGGQLKEAKAILDEMLQKGMSVDSSTYISLMEGLIKRQKRLTHAAG
jgi:pentatricopeptide repeat protein